MNILIADDEAHMLNILQAYFERERFRTFLRRTRIKMPCMGKTPSRPDRPSSMTAGSASRSTRLPLQPREDFSNGGQGPNKKTIDDRPSCSYNTH